MKRYGASGLADFEGDDGHRSENHGNNPEADGNLGLMPGVLRPLGEVLAVRVELRRQYTEVVVDGGALEDALLDATALAEFVVIDLKNHTETLEEEDTAKEG